VLLYTLAVLFLQFLLNLKVHPQFFHLLLLVMHQKSTKSLYPKRMGNRYCRIFEVIFLLSAEPTDLKSNLPKGHIQVEIIHPRFL
jgi:hypothetical protein